MERAEAVDAIVRRRTVELAQVSEDADLRAHAIAEALRRQTEDLQAATEKAADRTRGVGEVLFQSASELTASSERASTRADSIADMLRRRTDELTQASEKAAEQANTGAEAFGEGARAFNIASVEVAERIGEVGDRLGARVDEAVGASESIIARVRAGADSLGEASRALTERTERVTAQTEQMRESLHPAGRRPRWRSEPGRRPDDTDRGRPRASVAASSRDLRSRQRAGQVDRRGVGRTGAGAGVDVQSRLAERQGHGPCVPPTRQAVRRAIRARRGANQRDRLELAEHLGRARIRLRSRGRQRRPDRRRPAPAYGRSFARLGKRGREDRRVRRVDGTEGESSHQGVRSGRAARECGRRGRASADRRSVRRPGGDRHAGKKLARDPQARRGRIRRRVGKERERDRGRDQRGATGRSRGRSSGGEGRYPGISGGSQAFRDFRGIRGRVDAPQGPRDGTGRPGQGRHRRLGPSRGSARRRRSNPAPARAQAGARFRALGETDAPDRRNPQAADRRPCAGRRRPPSRAFSASARKCANPSKPC